MDVPDIDIYIAGQEISLNCREIEYFMQDLKIRNIVFGKVITLQKVSTIWGRKCNYISQVFFHLTLLDLVNLQSKNCN